MSKNVLDESITNLSLDETEKADKDKKTPVSQKNNPQATEEKALNLENTEDIIKYSHLILEGIF